MKKIISATLIALALTFMPMGTNANAAYAYKTDRTSCNETVIYQDSDFIITESDISNNSASSSKSGSTATGKYSVKIKDSGKSVSKTVSIKCSKNGTIS